VDEHERRPGPGTVLAQCAHRRDRGRHRVAVPAQREQEEDVFDRIEQGARDGQDGHGGARRGESPPALAASVVARGQRGEREERAVGGEVDEIQPQREPGRTPAVGAPFHEDVARPPLRPGQLEADDPWTSFVEQPLVDPEQEKSEQRGRNP
jgi:hypothetical protein